MKKKRLFIIVCTLVTFGLNSACSSSTPTATSGPSEEQVAATVDAAIHATHTASAALSATVDAAVQATQGAAPAPTATAPPPTPTEIPAPTQPPVPTQAPAPTPVEATTLSEEELAAAIDAAVADALAASEAATTTANAATTDGTVTAEETLTIQIAFANAEEAIALAESLITTYADLYGAYASETLALLAEIEGDLEAMAQATAEILALLEEGSEAATAAIQQIDAALETASASAAEIQAQTQGWLETLQADLERRAADALAVQADEVAATRLEAIQSASQYVETVRAALADQRVSPEELSAVAQAGANATASLQAQGGQLGSLSSSIEALTAQIAQGQWPQAQTNLGALESALPTRP